MQLHTYMTSRKEGESHSASEEVGGVVGVFQWCSGELLVTFSLAHPLGFRACAALGCWGFYPIRDRNSTAEVQAGGRVSGWVELTLLVGRLWRPSREVLLDRLT